MEATDMFDACEISRRRTRWLSADGKFASMLLVVPTFRSPFEYLQWNRIAIQIFRPEF